MKALVVIPARFGSTRFPGKVIASLRGKPLVQYPYEAAKSASLASEVIIATDSEEVIEVANGFGAKVVMTSKEHPSGTDRVAEVAIKEDAEIVVNLQADEPLIRAEMIDTVIKLLIDDNKAQIGTLAKEIRDTNEIFNPNVVKVVVDKQNFALYFSRAPIPFYRDSYKYHAFSYSPDNATAYKHIGIYSYRKETLIRLTELPRPSIEIAEKLEQLRALYNGIAIKVAFTEYDTIGVDTPEDLKMLEEILSKGVSRNEESIMP